MIIESIHIDKFAGLSDFDLRLGAGLNIIEGKNESGKSTVAAFIKFLFFGLSGQKSVKEELSERERYLPFNSAYAGGSAAILIEGKRYIIERRLSVSSSGVRESVRDEVLLIDAESGEKVAAGKDIGQIIFGVNVKVFSDTAYFRQLADTAPDKHELTDAIGNILFSGEEGTDSKKALKKLDEFRTALRHKKGVGGELADLEKEIVALREELESAERSNRAIIALEGEIAERSSKLAGLLSRCENAKKRATAGKLAQRIALRKEKRKYEEEANKNYQLLEQLIPYGKLPKQEDIAEARAIAMQLPIKRNELVSARAEMERISSEISLLPEYSAAEQAVAEWGSIEKVKEKAESCRNVGRKLAVAGGICAALAAAAGALCVTAIIKVLALPYLPFAAAAAVFAVAAVVLFACCAASNKKARAVFDMFEKGCSYNRFCDILSDYVRNSKRLHDLEEMLTAAEKRLDSAEAELNSTLEHANEIMDRIDGVMEEGAESCLLAAAASADETRALAYEYKTAYNAAIARVKDLANAVGNESDAELAVQIEKLGVQDPEKISVKDAERESEFYRTQADLQEKEIHNREISLAENKARSTDPVAVAGKLNEAEEKLKKKTRQYNACMKAISALESAGQELRGGVAPYLSDGACRRLSAVTGGKHSGLRVDSELGTVLMTADGVKSLEYLSAGTRDLAYVSLRLALVDLLYKNEKPPLIFDESFAHQDKNRTALALALLSAEGERGIQSLLFTCRGVEAESAEGCKFNHIRL